MVLGLLPWRLVSRPPLPSPLCVCRCDHNTGNSTQLSCLKWIYGGSNPTCNVFAGPLGPGATQTIPCLNNRTNVYEGRYVTIQLQGAYTQLGLCDVTVFARPLTLPIKGFL